MTLSTWHAAKGLEWPIVVLFGLESIREPLAYGVHVMSDRETFDVDDPLGGRWIHFWPNPYTTSGSKGPVKDAYECSNAYARVADRAAREALRVLYVGWTRARDRVVLAAGQGKLLGGLLGILTRIKADLISEPPAAPAGMTDVQWAGRTVAVEVCPQTESEEAPAIPTPGTVRTGRPAQAYPAAHVSPSSAPSRACNLGEPARLGDAVRVADGAPADALGSAIHDFIAADDANRGAVQRVEMAERLLQRYGVASAVQAEDLLSMADRLWGWLAAEFPGGRVLREWPVGYRMDTGTIVAGTADLMVDDVDVFVIMDHKSYRSVEGAARHASVLGGQLGCYVDAVVSVGKKKTVSAWVHLPLAGVVVPLVR